MKENLERIDSEHDIPWSNCVGYVSDNANVMIVKKNSVLSRVKEKNPSVISLGCACHLASLFAKAGIEAVPLPIEDLLVEMFYHFHHSAKRKEEYKEFLEFTDTEPMKIIKHCSTRWLSLEKCVKRILQQWPALRSYFSSHPESEQSSRVSRCKDRLCNDGIHLFYLFLAFIMPILDEFNTTFQSENALVGHLHDEMVRLLRRFLGKFVRTPVITSCTELMKVEFKNPENQHGDDTIAVGLKTREFLRSHADEIEPQTLTKFFRYVRAFYIAVVEKMMKKFPINDNTLIALSFLSPDCRDKVSPELVLDLAEKLAPEINKENLLEETEEYLLSPLAQLPKFDREITPLDCFWVHMSEKTLPSGKQQFELLSKVALTALTVPNSKSATERAFSTLRKIQTDHRGNLCNETIKKIMQIKINRECDCYMYQPDKDILKRAKSANN